MWIEVLLDINIVWGRNQLILIFAPNQFKGIQKLLCPACCGDLISQEPDLKSRSQGVARDLEQIGGQVGFGSKGGNRCGPFCNLNLFVFGCVCKKNGFIKPSPEFKGIKLIGRNVDGAGGGMATGPGKGAPTWEEAAAA